MGKEALDIEALVARAYREHHVDRIHPADVLGLVGPGSAGESNFMMVARHMAYGTFIDSSTRGANLAARAQKAASVPDDMLSVHDAVLALPDFFAEVAADGSWLLWDRDTAAQMGMEIAEVSGRFFAQPAGGGEGRVLHRITTSMLVLLNGRAWSRPIVDRVVILGRRPVYRGRDKRAVRHDPVYETPLDTIAFQRATYAAWRTGLVLLVERLTGLDTVAPHGPEAPEAPWEGEEVEDLSEAIPTPV